jgi:hypothetical protein
MDGADGNFVTGYIHQIDQIDSLHAIAVGDSGLILATSDGGESWVKQSCPVTSDLLDVDCSDLESGIIVGTNPSVILIRSEVSWVVSPFKTDNFWWWWEGFGRLCKSYGGGKYRAFSYYGAFQTRIYTTRDTWHTVDSNSVPEWMPDSLSRFKFSCVRFGEDDTIILGGAASIDSQTDTLSRAVILRSFDGGTTWEFIIDSSNNPVGFLYLSPINHDTILSLWTPDSTGPYNPVLWSTNLGASWHLDTFLFDKKIGHPVVAQNISFTRSGVMVGAFFCFANNQSTPDSGFLGRSTTDLFASSVGASLPVVEKLGLYPDPARQVLNFESGSSSLLIVDPLGRSYEVKQTGNTLDVSSLPSGVYFVSDGHSRAKFVKE